ncbi:MAG: OmpA family protein [Balneolaceae bacterium]|nr:OmpA family protein [Balneolaceae bacterium]
MKAINTFLLLSLSSLLLVSSPIYAQTNTDNSESSNLNRLSIGLIGGVTTGNMNINSKYTGVYGANVRYSINPVVALQANALLGEFISTNVECKLFDPSFSNRFVNLGLQGHINMYKLMSRENAPFGFSVYSVLGFGLLMNDVTTGVENPAAGWEDFMGEDNTDTALYYQFGIGTRLKLSPRIDIFAQFDYNRTDNDRMDGFRNSRLSGTDLDNGRNDHFLNVTAGIQFKLGSSSRNHADWHWSTPPPPPPPAPKPEPEVDLEEFKERIEELEDKLNEKDQAINQLFDQLSELEDARDVERLDNGVMVTFSDKILFEFDSSELREDAIRALTGFADEIKNHDGFRITIIGHTCNIGTEEYNQGLSERRAGSVENFLLEVGINPDTMSSFGRGELEPRYDNNTRDGREMNRRVEIVIEN